MRTENVVTFGLVVFDICKQTDRQINTQSHTDKLTLSTNSKYSANLSGGKVTTVILLITTTC